MSNQYRDLTAEQLRQELAERDARISDFQQTLDNQHRHMLLQVERKHY